MTGAQPVCTAAGDGDAGGRAGITRADIARVVAVFYDQARQHPELGPLFAERVGTDPDRWAAHLTRIVDFWANVMLRDRAYAGNPMQVHRQIEGLGPAQFTAWLDLFATVVRRELPAEKAGVFETLARRIGRSLLIGLERMPPGTSPDRPPGVRCPVFAAR